MNFSPIMLLSTVIIIKTYIPCTHVCTTLCKDWWREVIFFPNFRNNIGLWVQVISNFAWLTNIIIWVAIEKDNVTWVQACSIIFVRLSLLPRNCDMIFWFPNFLISHPQFCRKLGQFFIVHIAAECCFAAASLSFVSGS